MKRIAALLIFLFVCVAFGADVTFNLNDFLTTSDTLKKKTVLIEPQSTPRTNTGSLIITSDKRYFNLGTNGTFTATNMVYGNYLVSVWGLTATSQFRILVPDTSDSTNAVNLIVTSNSVPSESAGFTQSGADARFVNVNSDWASNLVVTNLVLRGSTNAFTFTNGASAGQFLKTDGTNWFAGSAAGGGDALIADGLNQFAASPTIGGTNIIQGLANLTGATNGLDAGKQPLSSVLTTLSGLAGSPGDLIANQSGSGWVELSPSAITNLLLYNGLNLTWAHPTFLVNTNAKIDTGTNFITAVSDVGTPASGDLLPIVDVSTAERKYLSIANIPGVGSSQPPSTTLTNLSGTGALTNIAGPNLSFLWASNSVPAGDQRITYKTSTGALLMTNSQIEFNWAGGVTTYYGYEHIWKEGADYFFIFPQGGDSNGLTIGVHQLSPTVTDYMNIGDPTLYYKDAYLTNIYGKGQLLSDQLGVSNGITTVAFRIPTGWTQGYTNVYSLTNVSANEYLKVLSIANGVITWTNAAGSGSSSPGGSDMALQFNQGGSSFAGTNTLFYDRTNGVLHIVDDNTAKITLTNTTDLSSLIISADTLDHYTPSATAFVLYPNNSDNQGWAFKEATLNVDVDNTADLGISASRFKDLWIYGINAAGTITSATITVGSTNIVQAIANLNAVSNAPAGNAAGGDMAIQFNQGGSTFAGTNTFFFDRTNGVLHVVDNDTAKATLTNTTSLSSVILSADSIDHHTPSATAFVLYPNNADNQGWAFKETTLNVDVDNTADLGISASRFKDLWIYGINAAGTITGATITVGSTNIIGELAKLHGVTNAVVSGPGSSVDNEIPRFNGASGYLVQGSGAFIDDTTNLTVHTLSTTAGAAGGISLFDTAGTREARFTAPSALTSNTLYTLPAVLADGVFLNTLSTDSNSTLSIVGTTGSGNVVRATSPSLTTPSLGAATATSVTIGSTNLLQGIANLNAISNRVPALVTNSLYVAAGAMGYWNGSTSDGGKTAAAIGQWTNGVTITDTWDFDSTTNECVSFQWAPGPGFTGKFLATVIYGSTNTAMSGSSNVVWQIGVQPLELNTTPGQPIYFTNATGTLTSSNTVQRLALPLISMTNFTSDAVMNFRFGRLGTNTADVLVGDARLIGLRIGWERTNSMGGY